MARRVVLVDRDGVLNRNREHYVKTLDELEILPGVPEAVRMLNDGGYAVLVVTNQAGIGKGVISREALEGIHAELRRLVGAMGGALAEFYVCPHRPEESCRCRKPRPGLVEQAQREWGFDLATTYFVGDARRDVEAARAAGCLPAYVRSGINDYAPEPDVPVFADLAAFARKLTELT